MAVTAEMLIGDAVEQYPVVADVFMSYGLHCVGCHVNKFESIFEGAKGHGMSDEDINHMIEDANKEIEQVANSDAKGFKITDAASDKITELLGKANAQFLRIKVVTGGCSGSMYEFKQDNQKFETDEMFEHKGAKVVLDKDSADKLKGSRIDYVDGFQGAGFKIENPNASEACGCGKSFA